MVPFLQELEISQARDMYMRSSWEKDEALMKAAAHKIQVAILALQLTSLRLIEVDCSGYILPDHKGSLAKLRCFPLKIKMDCGVLLIA